MRASLAQISLLGLVLAILILPTGWAGIAARPVAPSPVQEVATSGLSTPFSHFFPTLSSRGGPAGLPRTPEYRPPTLPVAARLPSNDSGPEGAPTGLSNALLPSTLVNYPLPGRPSPESGYPSAPAPMGIADLGRGATGPYNYTTPSFAATITLNSFSAYSPGYGPWWEAPNWVTLSLDTVAVGLPINGSSGPASAGTFWTENAVRFNGTEVEFEDNIWNFSAASASVGSDTLRSLTAPASSTLLGDGYYHKWGPSYPVSYPFTLSLVNTVWIEGGHPVVAFNYTLLSPTISANGSYDQVTFDGPASAAAPPGFEVNGSGSNPFGLRDDAEFVFGGDGSGSNANLATLNGTASLLEWRSGSYEAVPSAYDYGEDSGGTSEGLASYYLGSTEHLNAGPSLLYGLWNTTASSLGPAAPPGWVEVDLELDPEYGLVLATNQSALATTVSGNFSFVPTAANGTLLTALPPPPPSDPYVFEGWADGFASQTATVADNASGNVTLDLATAPATWTSPIYLNGDGPAIQFGASGAVGVAYSNETSTVTVADVTDRIASPFLQLNDYLDPVFQLVAAQRLETRTLDLIGVQQDSRSFVYDAYGTYEPLPGLTQGYSFDGGNGSYLVERTNLTGTYHPLSPGIPLTVLPTIEFYGTRGGGGSNLSAFGTSAVVVVHASGTELDSILGTGPVPPLRLGPPTGGVVEVHGTDGVHVANLTATEPYWGGILSDRSNGTVLTGLNVSAEGTGVLASNSSNLTADDGTIFAGGVGIIGENLTTVTLGDWNVSCAYAPILPGPLPIACGWIGQLVNGIALTVHDLASFNGNGLVVNSWTGLLGWNLSAFGLAASTLVEMNSCTSGQFSNIFATHGGLTFWFLTDDSDFAFRNLTGTDGGNDVAVLTYSNDVSVVGVNVTTQAGGLEGSQGVTNLTVANFRASTQAEAIGGTADVNVSATNGTADSEGLALILLEGQEVRVSNVGATNQSVAVDLSDTDDTNVTGVRADGGSVGVTWWTGDNGSISNVTASNGSLGVQMAGVDNTTVNGVRDVNVHSEPAYFRSPLLGIVYPDAPVQTYAEESLTIENVTAVNCSFAIQDVYSDGVVISNVRSWGNGTAVQLNGTVNASISGLFAESDVHGLVLDSSSYITVTGSTIEDSTSYGVYILDAENDTFYGNNFVANDGASALGAYAPSNVQVGLYLGRAMNFTWQGIGNYWSDWSSATPYPIASGVYDTAPAPGFLTSWLDFRAQGLLPGATWTVTVGAHAYRSASPLVEIPAGVLPTGPLGFVVTPPVGWGVSPRIGAAGFTGANLSIPLQFRHPVFSVTFAESGLPEGTDWAVTLAGATETATVSNGRAAVSFVEPNGTYAVSVGTTPGYVEAVIASGSQIGVFGTNLTVEVPYVAVTYSLTWEESGLPVGTPWGLTVDGTNYSSNSSVLGWDAPNGTYSYTLRGVSGWHQDSVPYRGKVTVVARNLTVSTAWFRVRYAVAFSETGLPAGTSWNVVLNGENLSTVTSSLSFLLPNGTYSFQEFPTLPTGLTGSPGSGTVTVAGNSTQVTVVFTAPGAPPNGGGASATEWYLGLGAVGSAVAVGIGVLLYRSARRPPPEGSEEPELSGEDLPLPPPAPHDLDA